MASRPQADTIMCVLVEATHESRDGVASVFFGFKVSHKT
jgi:hypothetical protein